MGVNLHGHDGRYELYASRTLDHVQNDWTDEVIDSAAVAPYLEDTSHRKYLENPAYNHYLKMHKVALGQSGYVELGAIADQLSTEYMPRFLDASAWAYAERGIFDQSQSVVDRIEFVSKADEIWQTALKRESTLQTTEYSYFFDEYESPHRLALNIAFVPLMKSLVVGDVTDAIRQQTLRDVTHLAADAAGEMTRAFDAGVKSTGNQFSGLVHELNVLSALLYINDPRYLPLPATARADSGYYHRKQTHDISILNQHWGTVRKVIPLEVKASASRGDRRRYDALIIRGKMHLTPDGVDPRKTAEAFYNVAQGGSMIHEEIIAEQLSTDLREMLRLYQRGQAVEKLGTHSLTRFYDTKQVAESFPGLNK